MATTAKTNTNNSTAVSDVKQELSIAQRFSDRVLKEFGKSATGELQVSETQKQLIQGYFVVIDRALKKAEEDRQRKNLNNSDKKYDNPLPISWANINMEDMALDLVHYARLGLDMTQDNMLFPIPYKNNKTNKYDLTMMEGYNGKRYIAQHYATDVPIDITAEVVYATDRFTPIKKDSQHAIESYQFEITSPFNRGSIVGGFAYLEFKDATKNKLIIMTMKDIEKRKPKYASPEFWGGLKKEKVNGQWTEVEIEGWKDEMVRKTLLREACSAKYITVDPAKIDENYNYLKMREAKYAEMEAEAEIQDNANTIYVDIPEEVEHKPAPAPAPAPAPQPVEEEIDPMLADLRDLSDIDDPFGGR